MLIENWVEGPLGGEWINRSFELHKTPMEGVGFSLQATAWGCTEEEKTKWLGSEGGVPMGRPEPQCTDDECYLE